LAVIDAEKSKRDVHVRKGIAMLLCCGLLLIAVAVGVAVAVTSNTMLGTYCNSQ
jgi:hypothetical protein